MSVTVHEIRRTDIQAGKTTTHEEGIVVYVHDGHLFVANGGNSRITETVAVYAPGKWDSAIVSD